MDEQTKKQLNIIDDKILRLKKEKFEILEQVYAKEEA